jgi:hypothetical protein
MIATNIIHGSRMTGQVGTLRDKVADTFAKRGAPPAKVAAAIVAAITKNRAVVPVAPEAWFAWGLTRLAPTLAPRLGARLQDAWHSGKRL